MRKPGRAASLRATLLAAVLLVPGAAFADQAIDDFEAAQQAAWNAHDAAAYTAAFAPDASVITALGWRWNGQADAARNLGDGFKLVYAKAQLRIADVQIRSLTPDLASVTLSWTISGARAIDGGAPAGEQRGFQTQLLQRRGASWLILSQQETGAAAAPVPPPYAPAAPQPAAAPMAFPTSPPPVRRCIVARGNGECLIWGKAKPASAN